MKVVREGKRKGKPWWTDEIKGIVKEKRELFKKTQERNVAEKVKRERKEKYRECKIKLKQAIKESKKRVDEEFGKRLSEKYKENRKSYWREVKNERNADNISLSKISEVLDENGSAERWGCCEREMERIFKNLMNVKNGGPAKVTAAFLSGGGVYSEESIKYKEVNQAIKRF